METSPRSYPGPGEFKKIPPDATPSYANGSAVLVEKAPGVFVVVPAPFSGSRVILLSDKAKAELLVANARKLR